MLAKAMTTMKTKLTSIEVPVVAVVATFFLLVAGVVPQVLFVNKLTAILFE